MGMTNPRLAISLGVVLALAAVGLFPRHWDATCPGVQGDTLPDLFVSVARSEQENRELHSALTRANARKPILAAALEEVIAGRTDLRTAAGQFRQVLEDESGPFPGLVFYPGATEEEQYCRLVIFRAQMKLRDQPSQATAVTARLEAELRQLLATPAPRAEARSYPVSP